MNIRDSIKKNIKEIPYEGQEIDIDGIESLITSLLKGFLTFSKQYELTTKGYLKDSKYYSRQDIIDKFYYELWLK